MGKIFYIADWHYDHENCISFDNRPFRNVVEMNAELVRRWNDVVGEEDTVYVLGDMFWCKSDKSVPIIEKLKGNKVLIKGNHDRVSPELGRKFAKVSNYEEITDGNRRVVLSHYPIPCFKNHFYGWYHLYGHVHSSFEYNMMETNKRQFRDLYDKPCNMFNAGAMMSYMNYTPRTLDEIIEGAKENVNV